MAPLLLKKAGNFWQKSKTFLKTKVAPTVHTIRGMVDAAANKAIEDGLGGDLGTKIAKGVKSVARDIDRTVDRNVNAGDYEVKEGY
jgi:hypothetical protein